MVITRLAELNGSMQLSVLGHLYTKDWSRIEHPPSLIVALIRKRKQMGQVMNQQVREGETGLRRAALVPCHGATFGFER